MDQDARTRWGLILRKREENRLGDAIRYMHARISEMRYAEAQSLGLPIGSGAVEATCKSLVAQRMKRVLRPLRKPVHVLTRHQALGRVA